MAQVWLDHPQPTHLTPLDVAYQHELAMMYGGYNVRGPFFYPRSPYGMGSLGLDCSDPNIGNPAPEPNYENCDPMDVSCVARNAQKNAQWNADTQANHDMQAACSAQKFAQSGGSITPQALTYGAGVDLSTGQEFTQQVAPVADYVAAFQPFQTPQQSAASEARLHADQNTPLMWTGGNPLNPSQPNTPPKPPPAAQPGNIPMNATPANPPAKQTVPASIIPNGGMTPAPQGLVSDSSSEPDSTSGGSNNTMLLLAAAGVGLFLFSQRGGR